MSECEEEAGDTCESPLESAGSERRRWPEREQQQSLVGTAQHRCACCFASFDCPDRRSRNRVHRSDRSIDLVHSTHSVFGDATHSRAGEQLSLAGACAQHANEEMRRRPPAGERRCSYLSLAVARAQQQQVVAPSPMLRQDAVRCGRLARRAPLACVRRGAARYESRRRRRVWRINYYCACIASPATSCCLRCSHRLAGLNCRRRRPAPTSASASASASAPASAPTSAR